VEIGVYSKSKALIIADDLGLDLVEISPKANPPVCKIVDYKKFLYEQKKRDKVLKSKTTKVVIKKLDLDLRPIIMIMNLKRNTLKNF